jgi:uncharacterized protein YoxC
MTPETLIPEPARWTNNPSDAVALLSIAVVFLIALVIYLLRQLKENNKTISENTNVMNKIYGAITKGHQND